MVKTHTGACMHQKEGGRKRTGHTHTRQEEREREKGKAGVEAGDRELGGAGQSKLFNRKQARRSSDPAVVWLLSRPAWC